MGGILGYLEDASIILGDNLGRIIPVISIYILIGALDLISLGLIFPVISVFLNPDQSTFIGLTIPAHIDKLTLIGITGVFFSIVFFIRAMVNVFANYKLLTFCKDVDVITRTKLLESYQKMPFDEFVQRNSADYIFSVNTRVQEFTHGALPQFLKSIGDSIVLFSILAFLLVKEPVIILMTIMVLMVTGFLYEKRCRKIVRSAATRYQENGVKLNKSLQEAIKGFKENRIYGIETFFLKKLNYAAEDMGNALVIQNIISTAPRMFLEFIIVTIGMLIAAYISYQGIQTTELIGILALFGIASIRALPIANVLLNTVTSLRFSRPTVNILSKELSTLQGIKTTTNTGSIIKRKEFVSIEMQDVSYEYKNSQCLLLKKVNLKIKKGELVGIMGASGSGKTTLIDLLIGLLEPSQGGILYNGEKLNKDNLDNLRSHVAYIPQRVTMMDDSIKRNIAIGVEDRMIDNHKIKKSLVQSRFLGHVNSLPDGYDTEIGESGARVSGGQLQRIAIARALYHDRDVLVMDEATSALDKKTEKEVIEEVKSLKGEKTVVIISHQLDIMAHCDYIYTVKDGVVEKKRGRKSGAV